MHHEMEIQFYNLLEVEIPECVENPFNSWVDIIAIKFQEYDKFAKQSYSIITI